MSFVEPEQNSPSRDARTVVAAFLRDESTHRLSSAVTLGTAVVIILFACGVRLLQ